jgi:SecD/SecF fusion protein
MFALMIGVIVGTYSSLFIASPIMLDTVKRKK